MTTKITIKQIKETIFNNVEGVVSIEKQSATNLFFIRVAKVTIEEAALQLKEIGFKVISINAANGMILANDLNAANAKYVRQCNHFIMQENGHFKQVQGLGPQ